MNEKQLVEAAKKLLSIRSLADEPAQLEASVAMIEKLLKALPGVRIERFVSNGKPSLLAYVGPKRPKKFAVLFNAHVDVVPGSDGLFKPRITNGRLYGRGAVDMKVAALIMTDVFMELAPVLPYKLGLQIVADEEVGGTDGTLYQLTKGVAADFVLAGEDTPPSVICTDMCGVCWLDVHFSGREAHSGYVWRGDNALLKAHHFITQLLEHYPIPEHDTWRTTANVASIHTPNVLTNRVPAQATVRLDIRYVAEDKNFASSASIRRLFKQLAPEANVNILMYEPAHHTARDNPWVKKLAQAVDQTHGHPAGFVKRHGAADVRYFSARGMPAVTMGLPDNHAHSEGEYVELAEIERYRQTLRNFLQAK